MSFEKLYAPSLKDLFVQQLQGMILSGELPLGSRLPPERELCQKMHISRAVVNGGIAELSRQGFLEVRPRQGTYVADYRRNGNLDTLLAIMHYNGGILGREEIRSILEVRQGLEYMAVRRAIDYGSREGIAQLGQILRRLEDPTLPPARAAEIAFQFQHEMTMLGGNTILPLIYTSFQVPCTALWVRFCRKYGTQALYTNMAKLYEYILTRNKPAASAWIDTYLEEAISGSQQIYDA
ncbi:MAG: GntR family transcriptional regulator [Eubacteriales bacterium]|nr:GntR family transcriptional regulator [Eubacteriales bacterium]